MISTILEKFFYIWCPTLQPLFISDDTLISIHPVITEDGTEIKLYQLTPQNLDCSKPCILHFHGNYGDVVHHSKYIIPLLRSGFEVWMWDYRGYGLTKGKPNHRLVMSDAVKIYSVCSEIVFSNHRKLILFGQSLGGHLAISLAGLVDGISGLVFDCSFASFSSIARFRHPYISWIAHQIVNEPYSAITTIDKLDIPIFAMHARTDLSVPFRMGVELFNQVKREDKQFWWYPGGHLHSYLHEKAMQNEFDAFIELIS